MTDPKWTPGRLEGVADALNRIGSDGSPLSAACERVPDALRWASAEIERLRDRLSSAVRDGHLEECDIPACNCGGYHSQFASRMMELSELAGEQKAEIERLRADKERRRG